MKITKLSFPKSDIESRTFIQGFPWLPAFTAYLISFGWFFLVNDSLWSDDWYITFSVDWRELGADRDPSQLGFAPWTGINNLLFDWLGPNFFRFFTFLLFFASAVCFFAIIKSLNIFLTDELKVLTLLFLLLPFNSARVASMVIFYTEAYFCFFLAWCLLSYSNSSQTKILSALLFFVSFMMHSLVLFFILPLTHLFLKSHIRERGQLVTWLKSIGWIVLCPFAYILLRAYFWPPTFNYQRVNVLTLQKPWLLYVLLVLLCCLVFVLQKYRHLTPPTNDHVTLLGLICISVGSIPYVVSGQLSQAARIIADYWLFASIGFCFLILIFRKYSHPNYGKNIFVSLLGLIGMIVGLIPYVISGNLSRGARIFGDYWVYFLGRDDWGSRHLTLQPLGFVFFIFGVVSLLTGKFPRIKRCLLNAILTVSVVFNFCFGFEYVIDHVKQKEIISALEGAGKIGDQQDYVFIDHTQNLNARGRVYTNIDWRGLVGSAFSFDYAVGISVERTCRISSGLRLVTVDGPQTHWSVVRELLGNSERVFEVQIIDDPISCGPNMVDGVRAKREVPLLKYFLNPAG